MVLDERVGFGIGGDLVSRAMGSAQFQKYCRVYLRPNSARD
jgi:hypothetical protein